MIDIERLAEAIAAGRLPREPYIAALPMYDWPERRHEVDAEWAELRDALHARGIDAPENLTRRNADLPGYSGNASDELDLPTLWQHPNLLVAQTCHGPLELWLKGVRIVGQEDYSGIEGGEGEFYSSAIVMRWTLPPSGSYAAVSPTRGENGCPTSPLVGEGLAQQAEGGSLSASTLNGLRLAYNAPDSLSGYLALKRDLEAGGSGLDIFASQVETGGHRKSIRAVAEGQADVAAIDCRSWELAQRFEAAARELVVVGWTGKRRGLPFVMASV